MIFSLLTHHLIKKQILAIVLCISKFQDDLFIKKFLLHIDCKSAKEVLQKDIQNVISKQIFARWQTILPAFDCIHKSHRAINQA